MSKTDSSQYEEFESVYVMTGEFVDHIAQVLGVVNKFTDFSHFFQRSELFLTLIRRTQRWLETGADGYVQDPRFGGKFPKTMPEEPYQKIWQVWRGKIWRVCVIITSENEWNEIEEDVDTSKSYFVYTKPTHLLPDERLVNIPALQHMNPTSQIKDKVEFGVLLREQVNFADAHKGYDYAMLNTEAGFHYNFSDEQRPFFESDEQILELRAKTDYVSRDYYNTVIDILSEEYEKWETELFIFLQSLIKKIKGVSGEIQQSEEEGTMMDHASEE